MNQLVNAILMGIAFGFLPCGLWCSTMIIQAAIYAGKKLPDWMLDIARIDRPIPRAASNWLDKKQFQVKLFRIITILYIVIILIGFGYVTAIYYRKNADDIMAILSYIIFIVVINITWLLPSYFLKRYLNKL